MTGKQLTEANRQLLGKLFQLPKLNNREIAWIIDMDTRTVQRRRLEFNTTGELRKHKDVSMNAEKLKAHHLEKLVAWHKEHPDALIEDMQLFLKKHFNLQICHTTVSRRLKEVYGTHMRKGRCARLRARKQREAEGRTIAMEIEESVLDNGDPASAQAPTPAPAPAHAQAPMPVPVLVPVPAAELYHDQRQLAPIQQLLTPQHEASQEPGVGFHTAAPAGAQQYQVS